MFISWPSIESFHNVRKVTHKYPELLNGCSSVTYRMKCKIHGSNAAIQCHSDGSVIAQSRTQCLVDGNDNAGFAKWVEETKEHWQNVAKVFGPTLVYGEWCGKSIQSGVAISQIPNKVFCVFSACSLDTPERIFSEPGCLESRVHGIPNVYVLPWHEDMEFIIDWSKPSEELEEIVSKINAKVLEVEACDPWVKETFGIEGVGEGLVAYPVSTEHQGTKCFSDLAFKAKGEKHQVIRTKAPVQVNSEVVASINEFVDLFLTEGRLEQGATVANNGSQQFEKKNIGQFLGWISKDIEKESKNELAESGLDWKAITKVLTEKSRTWYLRNS